MRCLSAGPAALVVLAVLTAVPGAGHVATGIAGRAPVSAVAPPTTVPGRWVVPVDRPVIDTFRPPRTAYGAGNRGWEFDTRTGDPVRAPGDGVVAFAGPVAGRGVVVIDHGGGIVSALTGMARISVVVGQRASAGSPVGTARPHLHLGFRRDGVYVDPAMFLSGGRRHAILVPVPSGAAPG